MLIHLSKNISTLDSVNGPFSISYFNSGHKSVSQYYQQNVSYKAFNRLLKQSVKHILYFENKLDEKYFSKKLAMLKNKSFQNE